MGNDKIGYEYLDWGFGHERLVVAYGKRISKRAVAVMVLKAFAIFVMTYVAMVLVMAL